MKPTIRRSAEVKRDIINSFDDFAQINERNLYDRLIELVGRLTNKSGKLQLDEDTFKDISTIVTLLSKTLEDGGVKSKVAAILRDFSEMEKVSLQMAEFLNDKIDLGKLEITPAKKLIIEELGETLGSPKSFANTFTSEIKKIITKRVILGSTSKELISDLKKATIGTNNGIFQRYVKQVTTDSVYRYQGLINQNISDTYSMDAIRYTGSLIATSRKQCKRWITEKGGLLLKKKVDLDITYGYLPDEIIWAQNNGSGYGAPDKPYYLELNEGNFLAIRGGYGCQHEAIPFIMNTKALERSERLLKDFEAYKSTLPLVEVE